MNSIPVLLKVYYCIVILPGFTDSEREISQNAILSQQKRISNSQDDIDDDENEDAGPGKNILKSIRNCSKISRPLMYF